MSTTSDDLPAGGRAGPLPSGVAPVGRRDLIYRTMPDGPTIGCGFISKPDPAGVQVEFRESWVFSALLLLEGSGEYWDRGTGRVPLGPGDLALRLPGVHHRTVPAADGRWREFFLLLPVGSHGLLHDLGVVAGHRPVWHPGLDERLLAELHAFLPALRAAADEDLPRHALAMTLWLEKAWRASHARTAGEDGRLAAVRLRLGEGLDRELDLAGIAAEHGMSYTHFRRWFRQRTGVPPGAWRLAVRLDHARALLAGTTLVIEEVARQTGFCDRYAFTRAFTTSARCPPGAFRRRHGG